jgi:phenylpyruvate tautomerase PptA (4-oxalocrotonate tautomerase family)
MSYIGAKPASGRSGIWLPEAVRRRKAAAAAELTTAHKEVVVALVATTVVVINQTLKEHGQPTAEE